MSLEIENYDIIYKDIDNNFKNKKFDFEYFRKQKIKKNDYYKILATYLNNKGYGYASRQINGIIEYETKEDVKIAKLLIDCNLIEKLNKTLETNINNKEIIEYKKKFGLQKDFEIKYKVNIPFEIYSVSYANTNLISHEIDRTNKIITIEIDINPKKRVGFTEIITIYTSCGVDKLEFTIKCEEDKDQNIQIENLEVYFDLCIKNTSKARQIFESNDFMEWLESKDYKTQILNYKEALSLGKNSKSQDEFALFCMLNQKYIKTITKLEKDFYSSEKLPNNKFKENIYEKNELSKIEKVYNKDIENELSTLQNKEDVLLENNQNEVRYSKEYECIYIQDTDIETQKNLQDDNDYHEILSELNNTIDNETIINNNKENKQKKFFDVIKQTIGKRFKRK